MNSRTFIRNFISILFFVVLITCFQPMEESKAEDSSAITFGTINYDNMTLQVYTNGNSIVYYSTDKSTWTEVDGAYSSNTKSYQMDISWVSETSDVTMYFKGDVVTIIKSIVLPSQNTTISIVYDKVEGDFTFSNVEEADSFEWRKSTDYYWTEVSLNELSSSYKAFLSEMETLRSKGAKIGIRIPQKAGTGSADVGMRASKEVSVTITARGSAPTVKVNSSKLTLNTVTTMEYYNSDTSSWVECSKTMTIEDLTPKALYNNGGKGSVIMIRSAATTSKPYSKTEYITVKGQPSAPTIGDSSQDTTYYYMNSKLILQFNKASTTNVYEYTYLKSDVSLDVASAKWVSVTNNKIITITNKTIPDEYVVYVRKKGTDENSSKNIELILSSAVNSFKVKY